MAKARTTTKPDDELVKVTLRLASRLVKRAKHHAIDANQDLQDVVADALQEYLTRKGVR